MTCPLCNQSFTPNGRQRYCTNACKAAAYRRRHHHQPTTEIPAKQPRRPITIYECATCGARALGQQRCDDCHTFMTRVGYGGHCPSCDEPIAINELLNQTPPPPTLD